MGSIDGTIGTISLDLVFEFKGQVSPLITTYTTGTATFSGIFSNLIGITAPIGSYVPTSYYRFLPSDNGDSEGKILLYVNGLSTSFGSSSIMGYTVRMVC